jgi:hypothetical protein
LRTEADLLTSGRLVDSGRLLDRSKHKDRGRIEQRHADLWAEMEGGRLVNRDGNKQTCGQRWK